MSRNLRVGLMGGSFDPIHIGHVRIASEARKALDLDRVLFLPSGRPPHKAHLGASAAQRLEMTKLATQGIPWAEASDIEVFREGTIYTVDTLTILTAQHPETDFYYIIGADTLLDLPNWRNTKKVCTMCRFICVRRPGIDSRRMEETLERLHAECDANVEMVNAFGPDISSTEIRNRIRSGEPTDDLLPEAVRVYIDREKLYRL